jgi:hypothetical protein
MLPGWVRALGLMSALVTAGCAQDGSLNVFWSFGGTEPASSGCGRHGVDSVLVTGIDSAGDGLRQVALCTPGQTTVSVKPGSWSVAVAMLTFQGMTFDVPADAPAPSGMAQVSADVPGSVTVVLTPPPSCSDGVDNNGDGRVDAADPLCQGGGTSELP